MIYKNYKDDPTNVMSEWDRDAPNCKYCKGTGVMWAFGCEVKCNHHTWYASLWLRYKSGRLWPDEGPPPEWLFVRMGESCPDNLRDDDELEDGEK